MDILLKIFIGSVLLHKVYMTTVHRNPAGVNWFNASHRCVDDGVDLEHDLLVLSNLEDLHNNEFWIGKIQYEELTPWIERIGCFCLHNFHAEKAFKTAVGYCQLHCRHWPYFSYNNSTNECLCFHREDFRILHKVNISVCHHPFSEENVTLVYKCLNYSEPIGNKETCMVLKRNYQHTVLLRSARMCNTSDAKIRTFCEGCIPPLFQSWGLNYATATKRCLEMDKNLISPNSSSCVQQITHFAWTSAFREVVTIERFKEKEGMTPVACLSGKRRKKRSTNLEMNDIDITPRSCNDILNFFVCSLNFSMVHTSTILTNPNGESTVSETSSITDSNTISTTLTVINKKDNAVSSNSLNTGAVVGGVVTGLITLVIITFLLLWIHRRKNRDAKPKSAEANEYRHELSVVKHVANMQHGLLEDKIPSVPELAVVRDDYKLQTEQIPEYAVIQKERKTSALDDNSVPVSEGNYDKLNNPLSRKVIPDANVYDIAGKCADGEYDTMTGVSVANFSQSDLYDTTESDGNQTYASASKIQYKNHSCNDTYNIIE